MVSYIQDHTNHRFTRATPVYGHERRIPPGPLFGDDWYVERFAQYLGILVCCTRARKPGADNVLGLRRLMGTIVEEAPFPRYTPPPMKMGKEGRARFHPLTGRQFSVYRLEFR